MLRFRFFCRRQRRESSASLSRKRGLEPISDVPILQTTQTQNVLLLSLFALCLPATEPSSIELTFDGNDLLRELLEDILVSLLPVLNDNGTLGVLLEDGGQDAASNVACRTNEERDEMSDER